MFNAKTYILFFFIMNHCFCIAQNINVQNIINNKILYNVLKKDTTLPKPATSIPPKTPAFIQVNGNILYSSSYRSYIDTPFAQNDLIQQFAQASLRFIIKEKYPFNITLSHRNSNSSYFKNITDVNIQFNRSQILDRIKNDLQSKVKNNISTDELLQYEQLYQDKLKQVQELQAWFNKASNLQEWVEAKEEQLKNQLLQSKPVTDAQKIVNAVTNKQLPNLEQLSENSLLSKADCLVQEYNQKKEKLAALQEELMTYKNRVTKTAQNIRDSTNKIYQEINSLRNSSGLYAFMKNHEIAKNELSKLQRLLLSVRQIGIGRSWVNYSDLTVKNISLTGANIEVNPSSFYLAFAAGRINYRFRDFIINNNTTNQPNQSLYLIRAGIGQKEKNNFIITFYNGKKSIFNFTAQNNDITLQKIVGIAAEARIAINENNYLVAEIAKSSFSNIKSPIPSSSDLIDKAFNLKIHNNEAYSVQLFSEHPQTHTRLTAHYRKMGENFQSFNIYPMGVNQEAWMVKIYQPIWKNRINMEGSVRKNDFANPIALPSWNTETIFKSIQASVRIPKYPFISIGYYPSSQLSLSNNDVLSENQYNTFNAVASHNYQLRKLAMNTNAVFTKFYNTSNDSGFIYFNASSITLNQSFFLTSFTLQSSAIVTKQRDLRLFTLEQLISYQFNNKLTISGSIRHNRLNQEETLIGGSGAVNVYIPKIGNIQLNYDKTYLPAYNRTLRPVDMGKISFYRTF